jgi:hypothetical protein
MTLLSLRSCAIRCEVAFAQLHVHALDVSDKPEQPAEGQLIARAMKSVGLSGRQAAERADLSEGRFRQIVNGYQSLGKGRFVPVSAPPETLARIAFTLSIKPSELESAGRQDAAEMLTEAMMGVDARQEIEDDDLVEDEANYAGVRWERDELGPYVLGTQNQPRRDGSTSHLEVRYWPGRGHTIKAIDFFEAVAAAVTASRRHTILRADPSQPAGPDDRVMRRLAKGGSEEDAGQAEAQKNVSRSGDNEGADGQSGTGGAPANAGQRDRRVVKGRGGMDRSRRS